MSLLGFMRYMAENPDQLDVYRRNPEAFFQQLSDPDRELTYLSEEDLWVLQSYSGGLAAELTTIMRMNIPSFATLADPDSLGRCIEKLEVNLSATPGYNVFFAEPKGGVASCVSLPNSNVLYIADTDTLYFDLHLCYTDPDDPEDQPQVLYIKTVQQPPSYPPECKYEYKPASMSIAAKWSGGKTYILLNGEQGITQTLNSNNYYNPETRTFVFDFSAYDQDIL